MGFSGLIFKQLVSSLLDSEVEIFILGDFPQVARYHEFKEVKGEGRGTVRITDQSFFHAVMGDPFGITRNLLQDPRGGRLKVSDF